MEVIHKIIDLENYKSRIPANIPPCDKDLYCIFKNELDGDWGMVPQVVRIPDELFDLVSEKTDTVLNIPVEGLEGVYYPNEPYTDKFVDYCDDMHKAFPDNPKWNKCYYIDEDKLWEFDLRKYDEKEVKYLSYNTLHKWFKFFHFYNEAFLGGYGNKTFTSAVDRWNWEKVTMHLWDFNFKTEDCEKFDQQYIARGGADVMNWLFNDVFGCYKVVLEDWKDYYDLVPHFLFYGQIRQWKAWFDNRVEQYKDIDWQECKDKEDCCDCREWFRRGGMDMYNWLHAQQVPEFDEDLCIDGNINVTLLLTRKIQDLGFYVPLISDFSTNERYNIGNEVVYNDNAYRLTSTEHNYHGVENGIDYSPEYKEKMFGNLNPDNFNPEDFVYEQKPKDEWDWKRFEGEMMQVNNGTKLTGRTTSKLYDLRDLIESTDDMGNSLHGFLNQYPEETGETSGPTYFIQPEEGTVLDMLYHLGNVDDLTTEKTGIPDPNKDGVFHDIYWGSIITDMTFYMKNESGERIPVLAGNDEYFKGNRESCLDALNQCEAEFDIYEGQHIEGYESRLDFSTLTDQTLVRKIYCDISYVIGGMVDRVYGVENGEDFSYYMELSEKADYNPYDYKIGVRYQETCTLQRKTEFYHTNEGTAILLYYYEPKFQFTDLDIESSYPQMEQTANFTAYTYCNEANDYNGVTTLRMIRRDKDLQLSSPYIEDVDIYIDRGMKTAIDRCLKLLEVRSLEALEQYGNGAIPISE